ncbi:MAG: membrane dipeptidase [Xanthomonadales bacterium]|nr:membrane dipeptidase [Xanthomonadales bacterium]
MATGRRRFLQAGAAGVLALGLPGVQSAERPLIIDGLGGIGNPNLRFTGLPMSERPFADVDARALADGKRSGLTAANVTMGYVAGPEEPFDYSLRHVSRWDKLIRRYPDQLLKVWTAADIQRCHREGRIGIIYGFQNGAMMGDDATRVEIFANMGVRIIQLTYNRRNQLGDGCLEPENRGLTEFGREVVAQLNDHRILVDLSHGGDQICLDAMEASRAPIAITHTGCRALGDHPRNKSDRDLRMVAEQGGVVGIYHMPYMTPGRQSTVEDFLRHIDHAIQVCGEDHVGVGTDVSVSTFDDLDAFKRDLKKEVEERARLGIGAPGELSGIMPMLPDLRGPDQFVQLADLLADRGYSASRIEKFLGGNFLRLLGEVWGG